MSPRTSAKRGSNEQKIGYLETDKSKGNLTSLIRIKIQNSFTSVLLDSGSARSCVDLEYAQKLGLKIEPLESGEMHCLLAANQTKVIIQGKCKLELEVQSTKLNFDFLVLRDLSVKCLIGIDFLEFFGVNQNYRTGKVQIAGLEEISFIRKNDYLGLVRLAKPVRLMPNKLSVAVITISGGKEAKKGVIQQLSSPLPNVEIVGLVENEGKD